MSATTYKSINMAGCGVMLCDAFYKEFSDQYELNCTDIDVNEEWLSYLGLRDVDAYKKDVIVTGITS